MEPLLEINGLTTVFRSDQGPAVAVDNLDLQVAREETLGLVGESGCGKSVTALSIMRLVPSPPGEITSGSVMFSSMDLVKIPESEMRKIRGNDISMIFQEPMTSLNPVFKIGEQIGEVLRVHRGLTNKEAFLESIRMLEKVGIPAPAQRAKDYPHQLSGGMRQRVMIAMALACDPQLMLADEPTTALDVTIQAQILELMNAIKDAFSTGIILITHDMGVVAEMADRVAVMYTGLIVEEAEVNDLFEAPQHPYTMGLLKSIPKIRAKRGRQSDRLHVIPGVVPDLRNLPPGCPFQERCPERAEICVNKPELELKDCGWKARCWMR
jgi:oligopeptide/dipeptide ABC transporter ATP-binding protein